MECLQINVVNANYHVYIVKQMPHIVPYARSATNYQAQAHVQNVHRGALPVIICMGVNIVH